jgi:hypothetical protein
MRTSLGLDGCKHLKSEPRIRYWRPDTGNGARLTISGAHLVSDDLFDCPICDGLGYLACDDSSEIQCESCNGTGKVPAAKAETSARSPVAPANVRSGLRSLLQLRVGRKPHRREGLVIATFGADFFGMRNRQLGIGLTARLCSPESIDVIVMKLREPLWIHAG